MAASSGTTCLRPFACLILFLCAVPAICPQGASPPDPFHDAISKIHRSIAPIVCGQMNQPGDRFTARVIVGTGTFIDSKGHFITAGHVVKAKFSGKQEQPDECLPAIYIPKNGWEEGVESFEAHWFKIRNCVTDDHIDIAVCQTEGNPFALGLDISVVQLADAAPTVGTHAAFTGFPLQTRTPMTTRGQIVRLGTAGTAPAWVIQPDDRDEPPWPGSSGSPLYLADGSVVGVVQRRGIEENNGLAFALPAEEIRSFLAAKGLGKNRVKPTTR